ncbi:tripartite tricarboxylate transporter TctB family protein [Aliiroseovarius subalbicans]|uniref:tripartite tricarboxylate transporter TctB family protein n=1 Tax=Aliiroseovarius subalbicans TaxID=2925840 RepID=UPI001F5AAEB1|nr:tripartite tricarboxylate transporter TctB family protein [Aliiroseovarius subalbicans]MCI2400972.1 tripartite tricarboxylate transporter TctB family protein [Aliiroseovarius subalbicans]
MMKPSFASLIGGLILLITAFLFSHTFDEAYQTSLLTAGRGPVFYPRIVLGAMGLFSVIVIAEGFAEETDAITGRGVLIALVAVALTGAYIFSIEQAGFVIPTLFFTFLLPFVLGYRNVPIVLVISVTYTFAVWYVFEKLFLIILPSSPWFEVI